MMSQPEAKPAVYFDGSCPLCSREIAFYQRQRGADGISWVDVSACPAGEVAPGLTKEAALARFHVRAADGRLLSGAAGFAAMWQALPLLSWAGRVAALPGIRHALEAAYAGFLPLRPWLQRRLKRAQ
jgi:3-demethoxyubiquinol 3-hydroxylase